MRLALFLFAVVFLAGLAVTLTTGGLLGPILIVGAVGGLGWMMAPVLIDQFAHFLSTAPFAGADRSRDETDGMLDRSSRVDVARRAGGGAVQGVREVWEGASGGAWCAGARAAGLRLLRWRRGR